MGQDQSTTVKSLSSPHMTPSSSTTSQSKTLLQSILNQHNEEQLENSTITEESGEEFEENEEGIIRVVEGPAVEEEEEELRLLSCIKRFDPFIKEQEKGFSLETLLGLKSNAQRSAAKENDNQLNPAVDIFFDIQDHIKDQMKHINNEQRILLRRIAYVDKLSTSSAKTITTAFSQAKLASEKVSEATILKDQASKAQSYAINIFKSLSALEKYLDPEDRIQATEDSNSKWPELNQLRLRASKCTNPPFERLLKSTTTNDLTTVGTSTSPLLEKVVVTGEPAFLANDATSQFSTDTNPMNQVGNSSTSTSSLALSRLRGISSRSIRNLYSGSED